MAMDEALLEAMPQVQKPCLRFYAWSEPAATFGYFQSYAKIAALTPLRPLIRRPTGGGLVPHDQDWTYSLAVPPGHPWYDLSARESYRTIHEWILLAFAQMGVNTQLAQQAAAPGLGQCFQGYELSDVLCGGRKIAGAAQRRRRDGLLIQGSVQPAGLGLERGAWQRAMLETGGQRWQIDWERAAAAWPSEERIRSLARDKYGLAGFNQKR
jgi:lipoate-protein ligase A